MHPVLEIKNLSAGYKKNILENISAEAHPGEIIGIFGRNGCGKTTLLNAIVGMPVIRDGQIFLLDEDISRMKPAKRAEHVSLLAQRTPELQGVTVREIMELGAYAVDKSSDRNSSVSKSADGKFNVDGFALGRNGERVGRAADMLGISDLLDKDFAKLSEGQRQLVMIGKLLVQNSTVMLLDEPDSSLDYINSRLLIDIVREQKNAGKTVIAVIHNPDTARKLCDRIWYIENGSLKEISPERLMDEIK